MSSIKKILLPFIPPVLVSAGKQLLFNKGNENRFTGNYPGWQEALADSKGYNENLILEKVKQSLLLVKEGKAAFERDSVVFYRTEYNWPLLASLFRIAAMNSNRLHVLDFGGSLGSTYYQHKKILSSLASLKWSIVEQENFVDCGKKNFEDKSLKFYHSPDECLGTGKPDVVLFSSVLQYLPDPESVIKKIMHAGIHHILIDKTVVHHWPEEKIMVQHVPANIYEASYPVRFLNEEKLVSLLQPSYRLVADFDYPHEFNSAVLKLGASYKGYVFEREKRS
ncbi:MAG: methyltransferase, TIGR04325 family [Bacteroidetes bacterium]|nr:methyltransferase, TIGR04325 family [Bacteroidota bacterium]